MRLGRNWYELVDFPETVYRDWLDAPSAGVFYNEQVKGRYLSKPFSAGGMK